MREIKFRAWVGPHKLMFQVREMIIPDGLNEAGMQEIAATDNYSIVRPMHYIQPILMQYTGLLDKNGVEIYEGDIVRTDDGNVWEMLWNKHSVAFDLRTKHPRATPPIKEAWMSPWLPKELEVIGNVYENPELLK